MAFQRVGNGFLESLRALPRDNHAAGSQRQRECAIAKQRTYRLDGFILSVVLQTGFLLEERHGVALRQIANRLIAPVAFRQRHGAGNHQRTIPGAKLDEIGQPPGVDIAIQRDERLVLSQQGSDISSLMQGIVAGGLVKCAGCARQQFG